VTFKNDSHAAPATSPAQPARVRPGLPVEALRELDRVRLLREDDAVDFCERSNVAFQILSPECEVVWANDACARLLGRDRGGLVGSRFSACFVEPDSCAHLMARLRADGAVRDIPVRLQRGNGDVVRVSVDAVARAVDGAIRSIRCVLRDDSDRCTDDASVDSLRRLYAMAMELYCTVDGRFHFVELNPAWERTLGWSSEELRAHPFEWFVHPDDVAALRDVAQRTFQEGGAVRVFENRYRCKDGSYRHLSWISSIVDGTFLASARDITAEVRARESTQRKGAILAAVAEMQAKFIQGGADGAWWDFTLQRLLALTGSEYGFVGTVGADADGPFLRTKSLTNIAWNDETRAFYAKHAPVGMVFRNMKTLFGHAILNRTMVVANDVANDPRATGRPDGHPPLDTFLALPIGEGEHMVGLIGLANRKDGYDDELIELLTPARILLDAIFRNVEAEHERSTAEARLRAIIESAVDAIVTIDDRGTIVAANPALATLLGYAVEEVLGRNISMFMPSPHREAHDGYLAKYHSTGNRHMIGVGREVDARRKDGSMVPIEVIVTEYVIEGRKQFTGIMRDISARRRSEQQAKSIAAERAAFARRLAAAKELQDRVLESSSAGLLALHADGRVALSNSRVRELLPLVHELSAEVPPAGGLPAMLEQLFPRQSALRGLSLEAAGARNDRNPVRLVGHGADGVDIPLEVGAATIEIEGDLGVREQALLLTVTDLREQEAMREQQLLNARLEHRVAELRRHQLQNEVTSECVDLLQSSMTLKEGMSVLSRFVDRMFPEATTTLYARLGDASELACMHHVDRRAGKPPHEAMDAAHCWSLRTRRPYATWPSRGYLPCPHASDATDGVVMCAPITSLDSTVGMLTVRYPEALGLAQSEDGMKAAFSQFSASVQSVSGAMSAIALRESLQRLALVDELTQIPNRRAFQVDAQRTIARLRRGNEPLLAALLDVDHFKSINDTLGHEEGDRVLQRIAALMREFFREGDLVGRIGGEEFGILLPGVTAEIGARRLEQLLVRIRSTCVVAGRPVTASIGFAHCADPHKANYEELMRRADEALYRAKETGRDRIVRAP
jgi:diguanylate cyclase (GGDEF)-like protein/PAS domain S-box-containing protein